MNKKRLLAIGMSIVCIMLVSVSCSSGGGNGDGGGGGGGTVPPPQPGTISVTSSPSGASFTITGSASYSGTAPWSISSAPAGSYTVTWGALSGYTAPSSVSKSLSSSGSISFSGSYVQNPLVVASATPNTIISGNSFIYFGGYVEAGHTLTSSWSADGSLDCFIATENQLNNYKSSLMLSYLASGSGSSGTISANIQNSDMYYAIVRNTWSTSMPVKLYQAELTRQ